MDYKDILKKGLTPPYRNPLLGMLTDKSDARVFIDRPKDVLGFKPATMLLYLHGVAQEPAVDWDDDLNKEMVKLNVRAVDDNNESVRLALTLRYLFRKNEAHYGEGFFNAVLLDMVKRLDLPSVSPVREVFQYIHVPAFEQSKSAIYCADAIVQVIAEAGDDLINKEKLGYSGDEAERIFVAALAKYLDERFYVTDGRRFGWK